MAPNLQKIIVAVSTLLRSLGIYILNGFNEELDDICNDKHIEIWSVTKALLRDNDYFLNCTVLESLLEYASTIPLNSEILVPPETRLVLSALFINNLFKIISRN